MNRYWMKKLAMQMLLSQQGEPDVWIYDKSLRTDAKWGVIDNEGWLLTPLIYFGAGKVTVEAQIADPLDRRSPLFNISTADDTIGTYWQSGTLVGDQIIATVNGKKIFRKTVNTSSYPYDYIRVGIRKDAYQYCKIFKDDIVLFDGSKHKPRQ